MFSFLFLEFILLNVGEYTDIINVCVTSSANLKSMNLMDHKKQGRVVYKPRVIPFRNIIRPTNKWDKFTKYLISKMDRHQADFRSYSPDFKFTLVVLMDFIKMENLYICNTFNPRTDIQLMVENSSGYMTFQIIVFGAKNGIRGVIFTESQYLVHKRDHQGIMSWWDELHEEFHVVKSLDVIYIIVFYKEDKKKEEKCNNLRLQINEEYKYDDPIIDKENGVCFAHNL